MDYLEITVTTTPKSIEQVAALLTAAVWDVVEIFRPLQDAETGDFVITNLSLVNWPLVGIVTAAGVALWGLCALIGRKKQ